MELGLAASLVGDQNLDTVTLQTLANAFAGGMKQNMQNLLDVRHIWLSKLLTNDGEGYAGLHAKRCCCAEGHSGSGTGWTETGGADMRK